MSVQKIYEVKNNQLVINLPDSFKGRDKVLVTVDDVIESREEKIVRLKSALNDPLFLEDQKEINKDFDSIDRESL